MTFIKEYSVISDGHTIATYYVTSKLAALRRLRQAYPYTYNNAIIRYTGRQWEAGWFWCFRPDKNQESRAADTIPNRTTTRTGGR